MEKILVIHSWEKLAKLGDYEKIRVFYNIHNCEGYQNLNNKSIDQETFTIKISRSYMTELVKSNSRYKYFAYIANAMLYFAVGKIRGLIENGQNFLDDKEIILDTYSNYSPPDPDKNYLSLPHKVVIEYKRKFGFL
jgi:hypothetical protein